MKNIFVFVIQIGFLFLLNKVGYLLVEGFGLPIPGNVMGMLILLLLLYFKVIKLEWIERSTSFLLKHLAFFFIPIAVGLMAYGGVFKDNFMPFLAALLVSLVVGMGVTGSVSQWLLKKGERTGE